MEIRLYRPADAGAVVALWERCGLTRPWNDPARDIARKLRDSPDLFFVGEADGRVVASAMAGYEGHRGWINYLAVEPDLQGHGLGRQLMNHAERALLERGCPKINVQIRTGNAAVIAFYASLGFGVDDVVSMGKRLEHDQ